DGQVDVELLASIFEALGHGFRGWCRISLRNVKQHAVRENARRLSNHKGSAGQCFRIHSQACEPPRPKVQRAKPELEGTFQKTVLYLKMLRVKKCSLRPNHMFQLRHLVSTVAESFETGQRWPGGLVSGNSANSGGIPANSHLRYAIS